MYRQILVVINYDNNWGVRVVKEAGLRELFDFLSHLL